MGFLDGIFGRSKPPQGNLDVLFSVPQAVITLEVEGFVATGSGSVCLRDAEGKADDVVLADAKQLIRATPGVQVDRTEDSFGFTWVTVQRGDGDTSGLVTDLHAINSSLTDEGFGSSLLCSTVTFTSPDGLPFALVYLYKQGTFYPFAPLEGQRRDNALELRVRGMIGGDVPVEPDLSKWLAIWGAPGLP